MTDMAPGLIPLVDTFKQPSIPDGVYSGLACKRYLLHKSVPLPETLPRVLHWVARSAKDTYVISKGEQMNTHWCVRMGLFMWLATLNKPLRALWKQRPVFLITVIIRAWRGAWHRWVITKYFPKADSEHIQNSLLNMVNVLKTMSCQEQPSDPTELIRTVSQYPAQSIC